MRLLMTLCQQMVHWLRHLYRDRVALELWSLLLPAAASSSDVSWLPE